MYITTGAKMSYEIYHVGERRFIPEIREMLYEHSVLESVRSKLGITVKHNNMLLRDLLLKILQLLL